MDNQVVKLATPSNQCAIGREVELPAPNNSVLPRIDSAHDNTADVPRAALTETRAFPAELNGRQEELAVQNEQLRRRNAELEKSQVRDLDLLELTGQIARVGGWELDLRSSTLFWTKETCRIHELDDFQTPTLEEAIGFYTPEARPIIRAAVETGIEKGSPWDLELPMVTHKGNSIWVRAQGVVVRENGKAVRLRGAFQDITARKQAEALKVVLESQLRESQKMQAIGTLAGGVAHDFNNILAAIMGNTDIAMMSINTAEVVVGCLQEISKASVRARDLVRQILSFSRSHPTDRKLISIIPVIEESILLLRATLPARIALNMKCIGDVPMVMADATQIQQIIINLATNASQAIAGRTGSINIEIDSPTLSAALRNTLPQLESSNQGIDRVLRLVVTDDGQGMTATTAARIFEPFFTTKPVGEGTGLGLAVVHGIVRTHQGAISVDSQLGHGSTFTIYLPATADRCAQEHFPEDSEPVAARIIDGAKPRVLYVDDDRAVMQSMTCLLEHQGFSVEGFSDQAAALEAVREKINQFDLIVTDYNMPCISGLEFAKFVRALREDLPIVIITGLIDDTLRTEAARIGVKELFAKPISLMSFCSSLQRIVQSAKR